MPNYKKFFPARCSSNFLGSSPLMGEARRGRKCWEPPSPIPPSTPLPGPRHEPRSGGAGRMVSLSNHSHQGRGISNLCYSILVCIVITGIFTVPYVYAGELNPKGGEDFSKFKDMHQRMEKKVQEIYDQLNLTDEQKKQLESNKLKNKDSRKSGFENMRSLKETLNQELMKPDLDMNKINEIQAQMKSYQSQMGDERLNSILEVRKILTPEQFSKFLTLMEKNRHDKFSGEEK